MFHSCRIVSLLDNSPTNQIADIIEIEVRRRQGLAYENRYGGKVPVYENLETRPSWAYVGELACL